MSESVPDRRQRVRRAADVRRIGPLTLAAVLVPLLALLAALLADTRVDAGLGPRDPGEAPLSRATLVCPSATGEARTLVASDAGGEGTVSLRPVDSSAGQDTEGDDVEVGPGTVAVTRSDAGSAGTRVIGAGESAPGLSATLDAGAGSAIPCPPTRSDQWFTGVGAGAEHTSVLELHNPDPGPATADVTVLGQSGPIGAGRLRGIAVPGRGSVEIDLGKEIPKREELTLHVVTARGRLAAVVRDSFVPIGRGKPTSEYLPGQAEPATSTLLLGVPRGGEEPAVVVANPGEDTARVQLRLVTSESIFAPADLDEVSVDPGSVIRLSIARLLASKAAQGVVGLQVTSSRPVTTSFRARVDGDLVEVVPGGSFAAPTVMPLPSGARTLVLGGAAGLGTATAEAFAADGTSLKQKKVELKPDLAVTLRLPGRADLVRVTPDRTTLEGAVLTTGPGASVLPLAELVRLARVPDVRPGLPG